VKVVLVALSISLPTTNWAMALAKTIEDAQDGDIIQMRSEDQVELGQRALGRMASEKQITFQVNVSFDTWKDHYISPGLDNN
jgi:hypothetical protein